MLWPEVFTDFIVAIDQFTVEAFSIVPAECVVGRRLGFYYELVATLLLPIFSFLVIMSMALLLYGFELQQAMGLGVRLGLGVGFGLGVRPG